VIVHANEILEAKKEGCPSSDNPQNPGQQIYKKHATNTTEFDINANKALALHHSSHYHLPGKRILATVDNLCTIRSTSLYPHWLCTVVWPLSLPPVDTPWISLKLLTVTSVSIIQGLLIRYR
jgi:hypothetical protein